mmetsp:Transcript_553/g.1690  ORF Transcript_553/g.1690 Transcript_553/m.1690 type:complete len:236 (-) Transcript_553:10-717(-)
MGDQHQKTQGDGEPQRLEAHVQPLPEPEDETPSRHALRVFVGQLGLVVEERAHHALGAEVGRHAHHERRHETLLKGAHAEARRPTGGPHALGVPQPELEKLLVCYVLQREACGREQHPRQAQDGGVAAPETRRRGDNLHEQHHPVEHPRHDEGHGVDRGRADPHRMQLPQHADGERHEHREDAQGHHVGDEELGIAEHVFRLLVPEEGLRLVARDLHVGPLIGQPLGRHYRDPRP